MGKLVTLGIASAVLLSGCAPITVYHPITAIAGTAIGSSAVFYVERASTGSETIVVCHVADGATGVTCRDAIHVH